MTMGHRVAVLRDGKLQQVDTPTNLYDHPENAFVAGFIGSPAMNLRRAKVVAGGAEFGDTTVPLNPGVMSAINNANLSEVTLGLRPEAFIANQDGAGLTLTVDVVENTGADSFVHARLPGDDELTDAHLVVRFEGRVPPRIGDVIKVGVRSDEEHVFHPETGERLGQ
jgi:multiple sugar transport system ATP-binding protein